MDAEQRGADGKIRVVLDLIGDHTDALTYDFRSRFGLSLSAPFDGTVTWDEMWSLVSELVSDPTSHTCAAANGWLYPLSREGASLANLYDLTLMVNTEKSQRRKIKPHPRPWKDQDSARSKKPVVSQEVIRAALARIRPSGS